MNLFKTILLWASPVVLLVALGFILNAAALFNINFWGVKFQDAHRNVFEQSKSYNHGMIRDLENLCIDYQKLENDTHKIAIAQTIRHRVSAFKEDLPNHVQSCLSNINQ